MNSVPTRSIYVANRSKFLTVNEDSLEVLFQGLDGSEDWPMPPEGELSIVVMDEAEHCQLHQDFLDDPSPTDVITFPGDADMGFSGEIAINVEMARRCLSEGTSMHLEDGSEPREPISLLHELTLYLIHGWLHLAGLDDKTPENRLVMRRAEERVLAYLEEQNLWPEIDLPA